MKMSELVEWFQREFSELAADMRKSDHHYNRQNLNPYHLEGDVWTHTMMVCKQAQNLPFEVRLAALLHDVGKPLCRDAKEETKRTRFFGHEGVSAFMALDVMKKLDLSEEQKRTVFDLVCLHTEVYRRGEAELGKMLAGRQAFANMLAQLGRADHEGRFASEDGKMCSRISCQEAKDAPGKTKELVLMCGLPGSGKSSLAKRRFPGHFLVSRDECLMELAAEQGLSGGYDDVLPKVSPKRVDQRLAEKLEEAKSRSRVVVDKTHMSKKSRRKSHARFGSEWNKKCLVVLVGLSEATKRDGKRKGKNVGEKVVLQMASSFFPPTRGEFDEVEYIFG